VFIIETIIKRNGKKVPYDKNKIKNAVYKATIASGYDEKYTLNRIISPIITEIEEDLNFIWTTEKELTVEDIQDRVEIVLMNNHYYDIAKNYILYRNQHAKYRDAKKLYNNLNNIIESYLDMSSWKTNENSNMGFSLQGLNNHISSEITAHYWLNEIYPEIIRKKHIDGDFHIHDLSNLAPYCCGWDLQDLFLTGFSGVATKTESKPPKHFRTALGQIVNFFYTLQGESAGAQAFSNFDTYLAPFVFYDKLSYKEVYQAMQEFIFNLNVPTRVGFQCMSEDTEILTPDGWKSYDEVEVGETIKTFNLENKMIEDSTVRKMFRRHYEGKMYNLKNRIQDQLISPKHKVVRKINNSNKYILQPVEEIKDMKSPVIIPVSANNNNPDINLTDEEIKLIPWVISDGSLEVKGNWKRITIYQSKIKSKETYEEIISLINELKLTYMEQTGTESLGTYVNQIRLNANSSRNVIKIFDKNDNIKHVPKKMLNMSQRQSKLFIETYLKADGSPKENKIYTSFPNLVDELQQIITNAGYSSTVINRGPTDIGRKDIYVIRIIKHQDTYINKIDEVDYKGIIWCPNTNNETVIARRNGKIFITGNTPFTNLTMDLNCPSNMKDEPSIIGGQFTDKALGDFQKEMDMINRAFAEVMLEGDAKGRVFSFPIPTYNITPEFDWDNEKLNSIWEMTAKYGIPYFANFVNSDMKAEDARSMAILGNQNVIYKNANGKISINEIRHLVNNWIKAGIKKPEYKMLMNGKFVDIIDMFEVPYKDTPSYINLELENGYTQNFSYDHKCAVVRNGEFLEIKSQDVLPGDKFLISIEGFEGKNIGTYNTGKILGYYLGEGWISNHSNGEIIFAININRKDIVSSIENFFIDMACEVRIEELKSDNIFKVHVYGKQAVGFVENYIRGNKATEKRLESKVWNTSKNFRLGIIDGLYETDGHKKNKTLFHTTNKGIIDDLIILSNSVGYVLKYRINDKNTRYFKADKSDLETFTSYELKFYDTNERFELDKEDYMLIDISNVKELNSKANKVYNFTVNTERHLYELPNGIITHQCCRLRLDNRELRKRGGSLFGSNPMTGSIGVVTLNMPRIGYLASNREDFIERVYELMDIAKESLEIKRRIIESFTEVGLYPYSQFYLRSVKQRFGQSWKNHFNTIGINGMNEAVMNFMGKTIADKEAIEFTEWIMEKMKERMIQYQEETSNLFNLEATPAEGASYRLAKSDYDKYGSEKMFFANSERMVDDNTIEPYYTNSSQLPVGHTDDLFKALELQDRLQTKYTGGRK